MIVFKTILIVSIILVIYNYLIYPSLVKFLARNKEIGDPVYIDDELPRIAIVFAAYNEERVVVQKMQNLASLHYPSDLLDIHIGLDHPSDQTAHLINAHKDIKFPVFVHHFKERGGKSKVLNKMFSQSLNKFDYEVVIMMDANVISKENCLFELVKHFKNEEIGLVGAVIENAINDETEIAVQEKFYIKKESQIKVNEGLVFGSTIGAFGACYAIRPKFIKEIPANYLMEDFYLSMHVLEQDGICVTNPDAIVYEDLPGTIKEEFKRKRRISTGNFQNLKSYFGLLWKKPFRVSFPFFSHKILRWLSPFFLILAILSCTYLFHWHWDWNFSDEGNSWILTAFILMLGNIILPFLDIVLQAVNINVNLLRLHRYFILMNIAMFLGFIDWVKGVKTNIWKPTKRL